MNVCANCVYKKECGDASRVVPCDGRTTKTQIKDRIKAYKDAISNGKINAVKGNEIIAVLTALLK